MTDAETGLLAARLLCVSALVLLAPGLAFLSVVRVSAEWPERLVLAFSVSYSWIFALSILVPLLGWTADHAAVLTLLVLAGLTVVITRRRPLGSFAAPERPDWATWVVMFVIIGAGIAGWVVEPPFTGEEALDFASLSRFADGGPITFENTSLLPDTRPFYLFQPYQLVLGMIARWSASDPLIAFVKFRAFLAPLCLLCIYALLRRMTLTRIEAVAAFVVVVIVVALEIETWERNALFPYVRRQGISAAVLVPALLVLFINATRLVTEDGERRRRRLALGVIPVMLVASASTHAMEVVTFLCFAATATVAIVTGLDRGGDRKMALGATLVVVAAAGVYLIVHSQAAPDVSERGNRVRVALGGRLGELVANEETSSWTVSAANIFLSATPLATAAVLGIPALALAALRAPAAAAAIALGTVPLALMDATPAGSLVLRWLVSPGVMRDTGPYFMLMGVLGLALGVVALAQGILSGALRGPRGFRRLAGGALAGVLVVIAGREAIHWLGNSASAETPQFLLVQTAFAVAVLIAAMRQRPILQATPFTRGLVVLTICLALPIAVPGRVFGGAFEREANATVFSRFQGARVRPSVLAWPAYYEEFAHTIRPPLPVPRAVVDELRRRIPPRQVLLAHPSYSCALVVVVDAYCINPESIYGDYFRPAAPYLADYVTLEDGQAPEHPFFNGGLSLTNGEDRLLREYGVSFVFAGPEHAEQIGLKLGSSTLGSTLEFELDGYRLYRINGS